MSDFLAVKENLERRGYAVSVFSTASEAAAYLDGSIDGTAVGFGGSGTLKALGLYELLGRHNTVVWHWGSADPNAARRDAMGTEIYLTSANALAETGEIVNIDGTGNRAASTLYGHRKVYFVIGSNKLTPTYADAVHRARNVAAPARARELGAKTPCALQADRCYDCQSPGRICRGMVTLWGPMNGMEAEVILVDESLGN